MFNKTQFENAIIGSNWKIISAGCIMNTCNSEQYPVSGLFNFILKNKISIINNSFTHGLAIDNDNKIQDLSTYEKWIFKTEKNKKNKFSKDELIEGSTYKSAEGYIMVYLGYRYIQKWKKGSKISITKEKKVHFAFRLIDGNDFPTQGVKSCNVIQLNSKIELVEKIETTNKKYPINDILDFYRYSNDYIYFSKNKGSNSSEFEMIEITPGDSFFKRLDELGLSFLNVFYKSESGYILHSTLIKKLTDNNPEVNLDPSIFNSVFTHELNRVEITNPYDSSSRLNDFISSSDRYNKRVKKSLFIPRTI